MDMDMNMDITRLLSIHSEAKEERTWNQKTILSSREGLLSSKFPEDLLTRQRYSYIREEKKSREK